MLRHGFLAACALALTACSNTTFKYPEESPVLQAPTKSIGGIEIPDSAPVRDSWTTYFQVKDGAKVVGYVMRYDAPPVGAVVEKRAPTGTLLVENAEFARIGFVTHAGKAFRFRGADTEELGVATIEEHLPAYFGKPGLRLEPIGQ
jgi:hypothetical protein